MSVAVLAVTTVANQWYFKITDYYQQLLDDREQLEGKWPDRTLACAAQLDWSF